MEDFDVDSSDEEDPNFGSIPEEKDEESDGYEKDAVLHAQVRRYRMYDLRISSNSCFLDDLIGFIYGPFTTRFWSMRNHINTMNNI